VVEEAIQFGYSLTLRPFCPFTQFTESMTAVLADLRELTSSPSAFAAFYGHFLSAFAAFPPRNLCHHVLLTIGSQQYIVRLAGCEEAATLFPMWPERQGGYASTCTNARQSTDLSACVNPYQPTLGRPTFRESRFAGVSRLRDIFPSRHSPDIELPSP
jgi:hypothetical protein